MWMPRVRWRGPDGASIGFRWLGGPEYPTDFSTIPGLAPVQLVGNVITHTATGVLIDSNGRAVLHGNSFVGFDGTTTFAIDHRSASADIDAAGNWWGTTVPAAIASLITSSGTDTHNVLFNPWAGSGTDTSAATGFQPDYSTLQTDTRTNEDTPVTNLSSFEMGTPSNPTAQGATVTVAGPPVMSIVPTAPPSSR